LAMAGLLRVFFPLNGIFSAKNVRQDNPRTLQRFCIETVISALRNWHFEKQKTVWKSVSTALENRQSNHLLCLRKDASC